LQPSVPQNAALPAFALAIFNLVRGVNARDEQLAVPLNHLRDPQTFDDVGANAKDIHAINLAHTHALSRHQPNAGTDAKIVNAASMIHRSQPGAV